MDKPEKLIEMIDTELGTSLIQDGFKWVSTTIQKEEVKLEYAKAVDTGNGWRKVKIFFTRKPSPLRDEFFIYIEVYSEQTGMFLGTMRALQANFLSLKALDQMRWTYINMDEFTLCLREIRLLMEDKLFDWFDDPVLDPYNRKI
jgi:hypothetical protein